MRCLARLGFKCFKPKGLRLKVLSKNLNLQILHRKKKHSNDLTLYQNSKARKRKFFQTVNWFKNATGKKKKISFRITISEINVMSFAYDA